jgi:hypothetical protein
LVVEGQAVVLWHHVVDGHVVVESTLHISSASASGKVIPDAASRAGGRTVSTVGSSTVSAM